MRKPNPKIAAFVAIVTTIGLMLFLGSLMRNEAPAGSRDIIMIAAGGILGAYGQIVSYYFGSSEENTDSTPPSTEP